MAPSTPLPLLFLLLLLQTQSSFSLTCTTQSLTKNRLYSNCIDLPVLSSYLHWTYSSTNSSLSIAFISIPSSSNGWVAWAINPTSNKMKGSQALIAYKQDNGAMTVKTFNISSYQSIAPSKIDFEVPEMEAEIVNGVMRIYAKVLLGKNVGSVLNQVWQVGGSVIGGIPNVHEFKAENLNSIGTLDLMSGGTSGSGGDGAAGVDSRLKKRNIHGILNAVSWGIMFPIGVIIARYLRTFQSADPAWFYLHVSCQISAYAIGVAGWATGLKLGKQSEGITHTTHRNLGITLFCFATLQVFALLLRPQKDHKFRIYWKFYHHGIGYAVVVLGILNVFAGLDILEPEKKWKRAYIAVLVVLGVIALLLEPITWCIVLKRKSHKSTKPYDAPNGA